jgi:hypothetical protein
MVPWASVEQERGQKHRFILGPEPREAPVSPVVSSFVLESVNGLLDAVRHVSSS